MRLVSAIWPDFHPFEGLHNITGLDSFEDPDDLKEGDILIIHGGSDIHPSLYNKGRSLHSGASDKPSTRDLIEWALLQKQIQLGNQIIGICRGAQMLCAAAGGYLIQHVTGHGGSHNVKTFDDKVLPVNSIHHQMMQPQGTKHKLLAWSEHNRSSVYFDVDEKVNVDIEPELIHFTEIKGFAPQWHPEMMRADHPANKYLMEYINHVL